MRFLKGSDKKALREERRKQEKAQKSDKADKALFGSGKIELTGLDNIDLSEDFNQPLVRGRSSDGRVLMFGKFSENQIHELMDWAGIYSAVKDKGYEKCHLDLQYLSEQDQRIFLYSGDEVLIHIRLKLSFFRFRFHSGVPQKKLLYIDWLMTRHPESDAIRDDRLFPGQDVPGLGIFTQISEFITSIALGVGAQGAFNIPEYFHDALLFHRRFNFYDPVREAHFRALIRDLRRFGAREISKGLADGRILNEAGESVRWTPGEMITALDEELEEMIWNRDYFTRVVRELKRIRYRMKE